MDFVHNQQSVVSYGPQLLGLPYRAATSLADVEQREELAKRLTTSSGEQQPPQSMNSLEQSGCIAPTVPLSLWSYVPYYSQAPRRITTILSAISPAVRVVVTPIIIARRPTTAASSSVPTAETIAKQLHHATAAAATTSVSTSTSSSSDSDAYFRPGLHCEALDVYRWWIWRLETYPLTLDVALGPVIMPHHHGASHTGGAGAGDGGGGGAPFLGGTPSSLRNTPHNLIGMSPMTLVGTGHLYPSSRSQQHQQPHPSAQNRDMTGGSLAGDEPSLAKLSSRTPNQQQASVAAMFDDGFPSDPPAEPSVAAFPFEADQWRDCLLKAVHVRLVASEGDGPAPMTHNAPTPVHFGSSGYQQHSSSTPRRPMGGFLTSQQQHALVQQSWLVRRELDVGHRVVSCLSSMVQLENCALTFVSSRSRNSSIDLFGSGGGGGSGGFGGGASISGRPPPSPAVRPTSQFPPSPLLSSSQHHHTTSPALRAMMTPNLQHTSAAAAGVHYQQYFLLPYVSIVPMCRLLHHVRSLSITHANLVGTTEPIVATADGGSGEFVYPLGATDADHVVVPEVTFPPAPPPDANLPPSTVASENNNEASSSDNTASEAAAAATAQPEVAAPPITSPLPRRRGGEGLPTSLLERLRIVDCLLDADALRRLSELPHLETLVIIGCVFPVRTGLDGLEALAACPNLKHLVISHCEGVRSIGPLAPLKQLLTLDLSHNPHLDDVKPLRHLSLLQELNVTGCNIGSVAPLIGLKMLWKLQVAGNPLGSSGGSATAASLLPGGGGTITTATTQQPSPAGHHSHNSIYHHHHNSSAGSVASVLNQSFPSAPPPGATTATTASPASLVVTPSGAALSAHRHHTPTTTTTTMRPGEALSPASLSPSTTATGVSSATPPSMCGSLESLTQLQYVDAEHCGLVDVSALVSFSSLRYLSLARNKLQHESLHRLPKSLSGLLGSTLEVLDVSKAGLTQLKHFEGFQNLRVLLLRDNVFAHQAFSQHLSRMPQLVELYADNCGLDDLRRLPELCPRLCVLQASRNRQLTDDRMPQFATMPTLTTVSLRACSLMSMQCFRGCTTITELDVSENTLATARGAVGNFGAADLATATSLEILNIANCALRDLSFLASLGRLRHVELRGNVLSPAVPPHILLLDPATSSCAYGESSSGGGSNNAGGSSGAGGGESGSRTYTPGSIASMGRPATPLHRPATPNSTSHYFGRGEHDELLGHGASANLLLRSPHVGPSAASPVRRRIKEVHADPLLW